MAILFGLISAAIDLPLPAEDFYRLTRAIVRAHPAPQDIALIGVDDKTVAAFGQSLPDRVADGKLLDRLIDDGVERVVFDRAGFRYHGRIKSLADAAREAGLEF